MRLLKQHTTLADLTVCSLVFERGADSLWDRAKAVIVSVRYLFQYISFVLDGTDISATIYNTVHLGRFISDNIKAAGISDAFARFFLILWISCWHFI